MTTGLLTPGASAPPEPAPGVAAGAQPRGGRLVRPLLLVLVVGVPAVLAAALACYQLGARSVWLDESATVAIASQHGAALWHAIAHDGGNMLIYYLLEHALIGAFGGATWVIRFPSVLATAATAAIAAGLGWRLFDASRRIALSAGLLTAVSLPLVFWGQNARGYALMVAFATGSFLALVVVLQAPADRPAPRAALLAYGAALLGSLYTGLDTVLVVAAQLLLLAAYPQRAREVVSMLVAVAVLSVPLLVLAANRGQGQLFWVPAPSPAVLSQALTTLTSAGLSPNFHETAVTTVVCIVTSALALAALLVAWREAPRPAPAPLRALLAPLRSPLALPAAWLLVPMLLALGAAFAGEPIELARTSVLLLPAVALLLARVLHDPALRHGWGFAAVALVLGLRLAVVLPIYGVSPEPWQAAARYVMAVGGPTGGAALSAGGRSGASAGDRACVAFYPQDGRMAFDYYVRSTPAAARLIPVLPSTPWSSVTPFVERYTVPSPTALGRIVARCPQLWLLASHEGQRGGTAASRHDLRRYHALVAALAARYRHVSLRRFGYAAPVLVRLFGR